LAASSTTAVTAVGSSVSAVPGITTITSRGVGHIGISPGRAGLCVTAGSENVDAGIAKTPGNERHHRTGGSTRINVNRVSVYISGHDVANDDGARRIGVSSADVVDGRKSAITGIAAISAVAGSRPRGATAAVSTWTTDATGTWATSATLVVRPGTQAQRIVSRDYGAIYRRLERGCVINEKCQSRSCHRCIDTGQCHRRAQCESENQTKS
jgi:hypothetical protein